MVPHPQSLRRAADGGTERGELVVVHQDRALPGPVLASVYREGKLIRSKELTSEVGADTGRLQVKAPPGRFEVHFEAAGYPKLVKRVLLTADDRKVFVRAALEKGGAVLGGGPSLEELAEQVRRLRKENAELRAGVEALRKEVDGLRKK
jgi:hypothetical protein